jgi:DNA repair protein RadC
MIYNIRGTGTGTSMPSFSHNDLLVKETMNERQAALKIANTIMKKFKTNLTLIKKELEELDQTDCYGPGAVLDLDFLHDMIEHAI